MSFDSHLYAPPLWLVVVLHKHPNIFGKENLENICVSQSLNAAQKLFRNYNVFLDDVKILLPTFCDN